MNQDEKKQAQDRIMAVKRALDEGRMREVEARTGWHRTKGLRA